MLLSQLSENTGIEEGGQLHPDTEAAVKHTLHTEDLGELCGCPGPASSGSYKADLEGETV